MPYTVVIGRSPKQLFTVHQMSTAHGLLCSVDKQLQIEKAWTKLIYLNQTSYLTGLNNQIRIWVIWWNVFLITILYYVLLLEI